MLVRDPRPSPPRSPPPPARLRRIKSAGNSRRKLSLPGPPLRRSASAAGGWSPTRARERKRPATAATVRGPDEAQLRFATRLTFEEYVTAEGWKQATLAACPLCDPGTCSFHRIAPYMRKVPAVAF